MSGTRRRRNGGGVGAKGKVAEKGKERKGKRRGGGGEGGGGSVYIGHNHVLDQLPQLV